MDSRPAAGTGHQRLDSDGSVDVSVHASATVTHLVPGAAQGQLTEQRWGRIFRATELIEALVLLTEDAAGRVLPVPLWRYEVTASGPRVNLRGRRTYQLDAGVFAPRELPESLRALLVGREALHSRLVIVAGAPLEGAPLEGDPSD